MIGPTYLAAAREAYALTYEAAYLTPPTGRALLRWARGAGFGVARWRRPGQWSDRARERRTKRLQRARARAWRVPVGTYLPATNRAMRRHRWREDLERRALE